MLSQLRRARSSVWPLVISGVLLVGVASPARATGIYWSASDANVIGTANLDGTGVIPDFLGPANQQAGVAVGGPYVYWANGNSISRANLDGTGVIANFITTPQYVGSIEVDDSHIYWAGSFSISRANLDGTGIITNFLYSTAGAVILDLAVNQSYVYWSMFGSFQGSRSSLGRANLDGTGANPNFLLTTPFDLAVDESHLYVNYLGAIYRYNLDGTLGNPLITDSTGSYLRGLDVDESYVYWSNSQAGLIGRAYLDGTGIDQSFIAGLDYPFRIAVVPEPATGLLLTLGLLGLAARRLTPTA